MDEVCARCTANLKIFGPLEPLNIKADNRFLISLVVKACMRLLWWWWWNGGEMFKATTNYLHLYCLEYRVI